MAKIIIIEDDKQLGELVKTYLSSFSHEAYHFLDPQEGLDSALTNSYDLLVLDVMMPKMDGFELLEKLRVKSQLPVLMLTARVEVNDKVVGLELGADDYLSKPFEPKELLARIDAILRRSNPKKDQDFQDNIKFDDIEIDFRKREVLKDGVTLDLTTTEFELLGIFLKNKSIVLTRDDIMNQLQGIDSNVFSRSIDISVSRLRQKLGDESKEARYIKTIWGKGYMFIGQDNET